MTAVARYEAELFAWLDQALRAMRHVQVLGRPERTTPTLAFRVEGMRPRQVAAELNRQGICVWDGDAHARELFDAFGVTETGGAVRLGLLHYNTPEEVGLVIDAVAALRSRPRPAPR
jgi:selenocysteine lyase/cysteine desulfurase